VTPLPLLTRLWFAFAAWFRVLFDGEFAARAHALTRAPDPTSSLPKPEPSAPKAPAQTARREPAAEALDGALQLLGLLQREGRFLDFIQQDIASFGDADVGAAARVVHAGCRSALASHAQIVSVRSEAEGSRVVVEGADRDRVKLTGDVSGQAPFRGVLRHRGWRIEDLKLPQRVGAQDLRIVAPAEVEL
jgi:hypothetical protein